MIFLTNFAPLYVMLIDIGQGPSVLLYMNKNHLFHFRFSTLLYAIITCHISSFFFFFFFSFSYKVVKV